MSVLSQKVSNWKDALTRLDKHAGMDCHRDAPLVPVDLPVPAKCKDISEQLLNHEVFAETSEKCGGAPYQCNFASDGPVS